MNFCESEKKETKQIQTFILAAAFDLSWWFPINPSEGLQDKSDIS